MTQHYKYLHYLPLLPLMAFLFTLPLGHKYCKVPFWAIFAGIVTYWIITKKIALPKTKLIWLMPTLLYILYIISYTYSQNKSAAFKDISTLSWLFLVPTAYWLGYNIYQKYYSKIAWAFIIGVILSVLISWIIFIKNGHHNTVYKAMLKEQNIAQFFIYLYWNDISYFVHRTYFSLYIIVAFLLMFKLNTTKSINITISTILTLHLILINSRAGLLTCILLTLFYINQKIKLNKIYKIAMGVIFLFVSIVILLNFSRFAINIEHPSDVTKIDNYTQDKRTKIWSSAITVWQDNIWCGTGIGDVQDQLIQEYKYRRKQGDKSFGEFIRKNLDAHNQFLETAVALGVVGLIILLLIFVIPIIKYRHNHEFMFFLLASFIFFNVESVFMHIKGAIFWPFFYTLFLFQSEKQNNVSN